MPSTTGRPRPVPLPTALVVKKGSKIRLRTASVMPLPLSVTRNRTALTSSCAQVWASSEGNNAEVWGSSSMRHSMRPARPSSAWMALVHRFTSTWPIWVASASMAKVSGVHDCTSSTWGGKAPRNRVHESASTVHTLTRVRSTGCWRLNARIWRTSSRPRRAAVLISCRLSREAASGGRSCRARSALPRMAARMLLKSCATPPASVPSASIFWDCASCACRCFCSACAFFSEVMSMKVSTTWRKPPCALFSG